MWSFQYKHGDRPLDGFTIQRAAGRGGFGEVYYALSDSGREVALKVVQGYEQIELRGISQCMNLKSPHLVTIFDVKYNGEGRPFVVMEFVNGPNLRQLLDEAPAGLGTQKAAFFLREMGKGLTFLHDCGIVHRDLKPANVFFENGYVKIGDYGLSKAISPTQHSGQTVTVGTVHYMAPEIGAGKYDRSIDIYAMGAVLYEMLTGTVPFIGASPSEILMKHLSAEVDMNGIPEPFNTVIRKAMAKNPAERYQSIQEMVEAVFGAEHVRMSMSHFSPDDLSMVAGRVAQKVAMGGGGSAGGAVGSSSVVGGTNDTGKPIRDPFAHVFGRLQDHQEQLRDRLQESGERLRAAGDRMRDRFGRGLFGDLRAASANAQSDQPVAINDALPLGTRRLLGVLTAGVVAVAAAFLDVRGNQTPLPAFMFVFMACCSASVGLLFAWRHVVIPRLSNESHTVRKLTVAGIVCGSMFVGSGIFFLALAHRMHGETWIAILAPLCLVNTWEWCRANRKERVSLAPAIWAGFIGFILSGMLNADPVPTIAVLAGTALVVQVVAPWDPNLAAARKFGRKGSDDGAAPAPMKVYGNVTVDPQQAEAMRGAGTQVYGNLNVRETMAPPPSLQPLTTAYSSSQFPYRPVPRGAPYIWLGVFIILFTLGLMFLIGVGTNAIQGSDQPPFIGVGVASLVWALFCFSRVFKKRFHGSWSYAVRPVLMLACLSSILISSIVMGNTHLDSDDTLVGVFFIVFPALILLTLPFLPRTFGPPPLPKRQEGQDSPHTRGMALGLAVLWICGAGGIHRFYVGKIGTGLLWLLTGGLLGIGQLVDLINICRGRFTDAEGRVLRHWDDNRFTRAAAEASASSLDETIAPPPPVTPMGDAMAQATHVAAPTPAAMESLSMPWNSAPASTSAPAPRVRPVTGGLFSAVAALLVLVTMVIALAIGLDVPRAVAVGLPDARLAQDIRHNLFGDFQGWPVLALQLLWGVAIFLCVLSIGVLMLARRNTTVPHLLRGIVGVAGLLAAVVVLCSDFNGQVWNNVAANVQMRQQGQAMDAFLQPFHNPGPIVAAGICLVSFLILSIPYRRRDLESKGVS